MPYPELVEEIPSIFMQFLLSLPALHSTIVFIPILPQEERFMFRRVCTKEYCMFRSVVVYGYKDVREEDHHAFEQLLIQSLEKFFRMQAQESDGLIINEPFLTLISFKLV